MKRIVFSAFLLALAIFANASLVILNSSTKTFYWECAISFAPDTGLPQYEAGDGISSITVYYRGAPYKVKEGNQEYELEYDDENEGWEIYNTQYPLRKIWINEKYILSVVYLYGKPLIAFRYNPKKGIITGVPSGTYGNTNGGIGYYNNGNSSGSTNSSDYTCPTCHGSGLCNICAGKGYWINDGRYINCSTCNGRGNCYGCHGRRTIR